MKTLTPISRIIILLAALSMATAYFVPLWQILMWAPQYPEGLDMKIWIDNITGDVKIISALNHYIGMRHIEVDMFPEFGYMKYIVGVVIFLGMTAVLVNRRFMLIIFLAFVVVCGSAGLIDFYKWGYDYGHNLDPRAPIIVPGMTYQPPLIGTKQLLNFTAYSGPDLGGWVFLMAGISTVMTLAFEIFGTKMKRKTVGFISIVGLTVGLSSCSVESEPLQFGKDACHTCKMTLMDNKFGAEIITAKGKIYKFDDANCMLNFYEKDLKNVEIRDFLIMDFASPNTLINARNALYVKSEFVKSPMASGVAAFKSNDRLKVMNSEWHGIVMSWGEIQTQFK